MSVPVPFGQFVPGDSPVHRIEPRVKLGVLVVFVTALFLTQTWWGLAAAAAILSALVAISGVGLRRVARGVRPVLFILAFTLAVNAFALDPSDPLLRVGPVAISTSGLINGAYFAVRIVLLMLATTLLTLTTSPVALTDGIARLLAPFERIGLPATDIAMMTSIAMRFVPTTAEEAERIIVAQTARGASFDEGGPVKRSKAYVPVLVPLFVNLFRRAETLALAMEARGYRGHGRTRLHESRVTVLDWTVLAAAAVCAVAMAVYL